VSIAYRLMYRLGFAPWDRALPSELAGMITGQDALPRGRALDLGSGLGTKAIFMASHGWRVTAVEAVPRAITEARKRAGKAGVKIDFRQGDVTRLEDLKLEPGFDLVFDFGCFHGLKDRQRDAYAAGVNRLTAPGAKVLMMAFTKAMPPVPSGVTDAELQRRFGPDWELDWTRPADMGTPAMARATAAWFCLTRVK
jgi:cyclopropane fatty-acyl-phospholipid synthase-like methyltransferase